MLEETKFQIVAGVLEYMAKNKLTQNDVARLSRINSSYVSHMLNYKFVIVVDNKESVIADKWFTLLSDWAGLGFTRKQYWPGMETPQYIEMVSCLENTMKYTKVTTLVCETGYGKTYITDLFVKKNPLNCIKVTVNSTYKLKDILLIICEKLGIKSHWSTATTLRAIIERFQDLSRQGEKMMIIIDESENMNLVHMKMLKGLYDGVKDYASIVLIGTDQLLTKLNKLRQKDAEGIPQLYRRLKAGIRIINNQADFNMFFDKLQVEKPLRKLLLSLCTNYAELHDYLEPVMKEADLEDVPVTEAYFRKYHNLPASKY